MCVEGQNLIIEYHSADGRTDRAVREVLAQRTAEW